MATTVNLDEKGRLIAWFKSEGDEVRRGDLLAEVETDKATVEVAAPDSGVLRIRLVAEGATSEAGTMIAVIAGPQEDISALTGGAVPARAPSPAPAPPARDAEPAAPVEAAGRGEAADASAGQTDADPVERGTPAPAPRADDAPAPAPAAMQPAPAQAAGQDDGRAMEPPPARRPPPREAGAQAGGPGSTLDDFLAARGAGGGRSELVEGRVVALGNASFTHNLIQGNLFGGLFQALRGTRCRTVPQGTPVKSSAGENVFLPDVAVYCGAAAFESGSTELLLNPVLLIEVLSPSTSDYDHGQKWKGYREMPSLQEYLLVAQHEARIEQYTRQGEHTWLYTETLGLEGEVRLESVKISLAAAEIYDGVLAADDRSA